MANLQKIISCCLFALILLISAVLGHPAPDRAKIRIHVPVKHHTHLITKTLIKTVHVGVPVKEHKIEYEEEPEEEEDWSYAKRKKYHKYH